MKNFLSSLLIPLALFFGIKAAAQISGPTEICVGQVATFTLENDPCFSSPQWFDIPGFYQIVGPSNGFSVDIVGIAPVSLIEICVQYDDSCLGFPSEACYLFSITVLPLVFVEEELCTGGCTTIAGEEICEPGTYEFTIPSYLGCDSTIIAIVTPIDPPVVDLGQVPVGCVDPVVICGQELFGAGQHVVYCEQVGLCDTIFAVELVGEMVIAEAGLDVLLDCNMIGFLNGNGSSTGPGFSYLWTSPQGHPIQNGTTLFPIVFNQGWYFLEVQNGITGCTAVDSVFAFQEFFPFNVNISSASFNCNASTVQLNATLSPPTSSFNATWSTTNGHIVSGQGSLSIIIDQPGTYCIHVFDISNGCVASDCQIVNAVNNNIVAEAGPGMSVDCSGASVELDGLGSSSGPGFSYNWEAEYCCITGGANTLFPTVNQQGWYYLTVTDNTTGCTATDSVYVNGLEIEIEPASFSCSLSEITLHAEVTGNTFGTNGFWTTVNGNIVSGAFTNDPVIDAPGDYCFEIVSGGQFCVAKKCVEVSVDQSLCSAISGYVLVDGNNNCQTDLGEMPLSGWLVTATGTGGTFYGTTDAQGYYSIPVPPGNFTVILTAASNVYGICANNVNVSLPGANSTVEVNFSVFEEIPCPVLTVDITNNILRRCADNNFFYVKYCNEGTVAAAGAYVEISLDPDLSFVFSPNNFTHIGGQVYSFAVGDLGPDECGEFWFQAFLDCDVEIAETHCTEAHIFPDDDCFPSNPLWSGASLEVRANCSDSTRFTITNVGTAALTVPLGYLVIEDAVMYRPGEVGLLAPGASMVVSLPANGSTWRLEVEQEPFHPFPNVPVAWVEGCGDHVDGSFSQGFVNQRFLGDPELHTDTDCTMNQAPFDPNDKQGFPLGHSDEHFIKKENQIEYLIRFQNTGNDTAFNVTILDTLGAKLDLTTLRPGAASHFYEYEIYGTGILKFTFPNIHLPDSSTDLTGSQGFVQFIVSPKENVLPGDVIYNDADIYFDSNPPITTNETFHTIEKPVVYEVQTAEICLGETFLGTEITADTMLVEHISFPLYDSLTYFNLQVLPVFETEISAVICENGSYFFNGNTFTQPGTYQAIFAAANGCDSTVVLTLGVQGVFLSEITAQICEGGTYPFFGEGLTVAGIYEKQFQTIHGCDSIIELELTVAEVFENQISASICMGDSYEFNGSPLTQEGVYHANFVAINGCDSTVTLTLSVFENGPVEIAVEICEGSGYIFAGQTLTTSGVYEADFTSTNGCDSTVLLTLDVTNVLSEDIFVNVCKGEVYEFGGVQLTGPGHYEWTTVSGAGCDSTIILTLDHWPVYENQRAATICHGDSAEFNGHHFYETGIFTDSLSSEHGCDSIIILDLTVLDSMGSDFSLAICEGETIDFNGQMLSEIGTYQTIYGSVEGCDSTVTLYLEVEKVYSDSVVLDVLFGTIINGVPIYSDTIFSENFLTANGCDSMVTTFVYPFLNTRENLADAINLSIFPNPTDGLFYVQFYLKETQNVQVEVLDVIGQEVFFASQNGHQAIGEHTIEIGTDDWPSGVYLVRFQMDSGVAAGKVVVR